MKINYVLPFEYLWKSVCRIQKEENGSEDEKSPIQWPSIFLNFMSNPKQYIMKNDMIK